jgi:1-acyl-sn-glycerol-3-phosphate acyltransferase
MISSFAEIRLMAWARRIGEFAYGCYAWVLFILVMLIFGSAIVMSLAPRRGRPIARFAARLLFRLGRMPISVNGLERLPAGPHILLLNHTSFLDAIALTALLPSRPGYAFIARQQFRSQALLWPLLRAVGTVVLKDADARHHASNVNRMIDALTHGERIVVFPEGGFSAEAALKPFHSGAFVAAANAEVPVVVAGLRGARTALRLGSWLPRRSPIHLEIGATLIPAGKDESHLRQLNESAHQAMIPLTGEPDSST